MSLSLYSQLCTYRNLELAFKKARKGKTLKKDVVDFEIQLEENLQQIQNELIFHIYQPKPLKTFVLRDPKTRKISKSHFRDRVVHHALCNFIAPIMEKSFIFDSYANRIGKGTFKAIKRFEFFCRKASHNYTRETFVLKGDVKKYFENVDHSILFIILKKTIDDERVLWLIMRILQNYRTKEGNKGMPLGNLTSQFFANVYLNELDQYVKHKLRAKFYVRYVDDFIIIGCTREKLQYYKEKIDFFLNKKLYLQLHNQKSRIISIYTGIEFLGMRIFPFHKLLKKKNIRKFQRGFQQICYDFEKYLVEYDTVYDFVEGWMAYAKNANTYSLRKKILHEFENRFVGEISHKEINRS